MRNSADITGGFSKLKSNLKTMTFLQKIGYLWTRCKGFLLGVIAVALFIAVLVTVLDSVKKSTVMSGITVNVQITDEGVLYLREQFREHLGVESDRKVLYFNQSTMESGNDAANMDNYYAIQSLNALCAGGEIDYMILDQVGFEIMLNQELLVDLRNVYTDEELQTMTGMLEYCQIDDSEEIIPIALNITDTAFIQEHTEETGKVYFAFATGSPRAETCRELLLHLLAWNQ